MERRGKYPDTKWFTYYNANPMGKITGDCVVRAIAEATGVPYNQVVRDLAELQIATGYQSNSKECYGKYLKSLGWVQHKQPRREDRTKYTGKQFLDRFKPALCIAHIGTHHIVCIRDAKILDIWDSSKKCIGIYYTKDKADLS